jgi:CDP-diglyceride synthetase
MLLPRLITAVVGIPLIILTVYWGSIPFFVMMFGVVFLALREYFILAGQGKYESQPVIGMITGMMLFFAIFLNGTGMGPAAENQGTVALLSLLLLPVFAREMFRSSPQRAIERLASVQSLDWSGFSPPPWPRTTLVSDHRQPSPEPTSMSRTRLAESCP